AEYDAAIDSYTKAIEIDSKSVIAYSNMAGAYLSIDDPESAKKILYNGWENTENEELLDNYHAVILNEAVDKMNRKETDIDVVDSMVTVLEEDNGNTDAIELIDAAYSRCFEEAYGDDINALFRPDHVKDKSDGVSECSFEKYSSVVDRMINVYNTAPSEELKKIIREYMIPMEDSFTLNVEDVPEYNGLLEKAMAITGSDENIDSFMACLDDSQKVQGIFADIFTQLDVGNVDELRKFVVSDEYIALRDIFLNKDETPQENTVYVPISREAIILNRKDDKWSYRFLSFEENPSTAGVITLWANYFEDDGVQRSSISYEPASIEDNMYPHTKYSVTYLYSYITSGNSTRVAKMNYRLDTTIERRDGTVDETIVGDWGGANEWVMDIDTIESRIRA
ncbi:MAG: hypothetical protein IK123_08865, partial [Lachnospiraceae bacterium]|nr:hypothetical protein [Lachnospiraceae bacterium]